MALTFVLPPSLGPAKAAARAELISAALERDLGEPVTAVVAESYADLERQAITASAELIWAPAVVSAKLGSARAMLTIVRAGKSTYRSAIVGRREDRLALDRLSGLRAAWVDPLSAGGYLLATALLRARGVDPDRTFADQQFLGSHRAAVEAVLHGGADVAAVSVNGDDEESIASMLRWYAGPAGDHLGAIALSERCPNDAVVITSRVSESEAKLLIEKLSPASPGARARSRLLAALEADRLEAPDAEDYRRLRALLWAEPPPRRSDSPPRRTERPPR